MINKISLLLNNHLHKFIIVCILLLASCIYLYKIDVLSLGCDEIFTINIINLPSLNEVIREGNIEDTHPPLYHILLFFFVKLFGITEYTIRLFSVICEILTIFFIYKLARKIFSVNESIISALILLFNTYLLQSISQNARGYSLLLLLSIITFIFLIRIIKNIDNMNVINFNSIMYILFSTLNIYTHYFALFLLANQLLFLLIFYRKKVIKHLFFICITIFVLYSPWIQFIEKKGVLTFEPNYIKWLLDCVFFSYKYELILAIFLLTPIIFICYDKILKKYSMKLIFTKYKYEIFLIYFSLIPYLILFLIDRYLLACYAQRYIIYLIPIHTLLISRGIVLIFRNFILQSIFVFILVVSLSFNLLETQCGRFTEFYCDNPRGAIESMYRIYKNNSDKKIYILFVGVHHFDFYISKYLNNVEKDRIILIDWRKQNVDADIIEFLNNKKPEYVLTLQSCHTKYLQENYEIIEQEQFKYCLDVYLIKTNIN